MSTVPVVVATKLPSTLSNAIAPNSVYVPPSAIPIVEDPVTVITGDVVSGVSDVST